MLEKLVCKPNIDTIDAVGRLVVRLMEIETSLKHSQTQCLSKPDVWNLPIRQFLEKIFVLTLEILLMVH